MTRWYLKNVYSIIITNNRVFILHDIFNALKNKKNSSFKFLL